MTVQQVAYDDIRIGDIIVAERRRGGRLIGRYSGPMTSSAFNGAPRLLGWPVWPAGHPATSDDCLVFVSASREVHLPTAFGARIRLTDAINADVQLVRLAKFWALNDSAIHSMSDQEVAQRQFEVLHDPEATS